MCVVCCCLITLTIKYNSFNGVITIEIITVHTYNNIHI